jgi:hypothetical protein
MGGVAITKLFFFVAQRGFLKQQKMLTFTFRKLKLIFFSFPAKNGEVFFKH